MGIDFCYGCYLDELYHYYPFLDNVNIYIVDPNTWQNLGFSYDVLAATNAVDTIVIRSDLREPVFKHSLYHELEHFIDRDAPEYVIDGRAREKSGFSWNYETKTNYWNSQPIELNIKIKEPTYID